MGINNDCVNNESTSLTNTTQMLSPLALYLLPSVVSATLLGLPANALILRLLLGKPGICSTSEIFTLNLAVFDILFCISLPVEYTLYRLPGCLWTANFLCWSLNQVGRPLLLCLLCLDSYLAVCRPLAFLRLKDPKLRLSLCFGVSVLTATFCVLMTFSEQRWHVIAALLITVAITSTCNILVLRSLRRSGPSRTEAHPVKKRAFKIVLTVFVLINSHYVLPLVEYVLRKFGPSVFTLFSPLTAVTYMVVTLGSVTQPLWYLIRTERLPKVKCPCGSAAEPPPSKTDTVATI